MSGCPLRALGSTAIYRITTYLARTTKPAYVLCAYIVGRPHGTSALPGELAWYADRENCSSQQMAAMMNESTTVETSSIHQLGRAAPTQPQRALPSLCCRGCAD
eukprot:3529739-Pleurochrysis_carterae.AAC.2